MKRKPKPPQPPNEKDLTPAQQRAIDLVLSYAIGDDYLEVMEANRKNSADAAARELDRIAVEYAEREAERKRLWGKKFPRVLGQKPDDSSNPVKSGKNPVKRGPGKRARTNRRGVGATSEPLTP